MSEVKSGFRRLLELTDKSAREELNSYYIISESRMDNYLNCLENGAKQIAELRAQLAEAQKEIEKRNSKTWCAYCGFEIDIDDEASTKISEHIMNCPKHPIRIYERHSEALEAENAALYAKLKLIEGIFIKYGKNIDYIINHSLGINKELWQAIKAAYEGNDGLF